MTPTEHDKRHLIVQTAYDLFKRDGFHATRDRSDHRRGAVAKMTMYRHFRARIS